MKHFVLHRQPLVKRDDTELSHDSTDRPCFSQIESELLKKDEEPVVPISVAMVSITMFTYAMDVASSVALCFWLFDIGRWWWWMTIGFLFASLFLVNMFSIRWYIHDHQEEKPYLPEVTPSHWIMRGLFHAMLLGPLIRYWELFLYGLHTCDKSDPKRNQYRLMFLQEDRDVSTLALVGSFVKSAPLLVLQMYLLTQNSFFIDLSANRAQAINLVTSLVELSLAQSSYHRALRRSSPYKKNMNKVGAFIQLFSHCCVIGSRVIALAVFATAYGHWIVVFVAGHWALMTIWLIFLRTNSCATASGQPRPIEELFFNVVIGVIYVFCFVNVKDEPTRWKYTIFYIIIWIENVALVILWFLKADHDLWYRIPLLASVVLSLAIGLALLAVYYQFLHPNKLPKNAQE
ncbi:XK-related protein 6 [Parasteatoda tepidariorum]|uniref:XK-related protein 6 n=1 Tax=Parasteatoda tepidariorum TaxID=114398 RepID=UPI00077FC87B|nr:XK-related protein 6 [Parasteatoda tepidariorum]